MGDNQSTKLFEHSGNNAPDIPVALSTNTVTGLVPIRAPMLMEKASTQ